MDSLQTLEGVSANQLYKIDPVEVHYYIGELETHMPEVGLYDLDYERSDAQRRVEMRVISQFDADERRYYRLQTVWFDSSPVMIIQNAGREGRDHQARFITDTEKFTQMAAYLVTLNKPEEHINSDIIDPDETRDDLAFFYSWNAFEDRE